MFHKINPNIKALLTGLITLPLFACGSGDESTPGANINSDATVTYVGIFTTEPEPQSESGEADFFFIENGVSVSRLRNASGTFNTDQCRVTRRNTQSSEQLFDSGRYRTPYPSPDLGEPSLVRISAGNSIQIYNDGDLYTSWESLSVSGDDDYISYAGDLPGILPSGLTAEIPGDAFPPVSGLTIPAVEAPEVVTPSVASPLKAGTVIEWDIPDNNQPIRNTISLQARWVNEAANETTNLDCVFNDDGEGRLPDAIQTALGPDFSTTDVRIFRESHFEYQSGDVYVMVTTTSIDAQID